MNQRLRLSKLWGYILKHLRLLSYYPPYLFSLMVPRSKRIWVFGAWFGKRYSDNSRYVFEHVLATEPEIKAVWLTRDPSIARELSRQGKPALLATSLAGFWTACRAGLTFVSCDARDVNGIAISRSRRIQLWHGTPLKKIESDDTLKKYRPVSPLAAFRRNLRFFVYPFLRERWDILTAPSEYVSQRLASAFRQSARSVVVTGYPRGDIILSKHPPRIPAVEAFKARYGASRLLLYAPTYRGDALDPHEAQGALFDSLDEAALEATLERHDAVMVMKMHFGHRFATRGPGGDVARSRIKLLTEAELADINFLLPHVDLLLTDYSSILFDYLLLDRPVIFLPFDLEEYVCRDRELYDDYETVTPGPKCRSWPEAIEAIDRLLSGPDLYAEARRKVRHLFNAHLDTRNAERVVTIAKLLVSGSKLDLLTARSHPA